MKALMWTNPRQMGMTELETPLPREGEVRIRVRSVGICGSDLEGYLGHNSLRTPPLLMGHEISGVVEALGDSCKRLHEGDRVVVNPLISCGTCLSCIRGRSNLCVNRQIVGIHRPGGYAEYVTVPESCVYPIPDRLSFRSASLTEPLACALRAARRAFDSHSVPGVVVIGTGALGVLAAYVSRILGASKVILLDRNEKRIDNMKKLGFDHVIQAGSGDAVAQIRDAAGPRGVDIVIDAAGFQPTRELAVGILNAGGTVMNIGLGIDGTELPVNHLIRQEIEVKGSFCYTVQDFTDALELLSLEKIHERGWSRTEALEQGGECFASLTDGLVGESKIFLEP
ncbi:zinc-dependent alcohol dehydrogenase [Paenibacillus humicola]|uniref:zinc-dependent alcohol dehydrogenase n=1 Tax=Paenibacillus humicola TaxID=3110540 RepID=UPI00237B2024|nr:alcohol dehydrogenase catalytic domain-containing protein [Paenibacillus humicola]